VTTKGGTQKRVYVQTSDGKPVSGGAITWSAATAHSSVTYGLTADGVIDFPLAPAGAVTVSLTDGVMPDGSLVSGTWNATLGFDKDVLKLPLVSSGAHRVHVTIPGGLPVGNASVSLTGLSSSKTVAGFSFRSPAGSLSGATDAAGLFTAYGYANGSVTATVVYDDGVITQTPAPFDASAADSSLELEFSPFVQASVASSTTTAGAAVPVVLSATAPTIPNPAAHGFHALKGQPGVKVTLVLPAGAAANVGTCKASLSGYTNSTGKVTLKVCASKSGVFRVKSAGAVPVGAFTLLVKGKPSLPPTALTAKSKTVGLISGQYGTASVSWAKPFFTGGATVTKYTVTLSRAGAPTITKVVTVKAGTKLALNIGGLTHAKTYTVKVTATTKYGTSDAAVTKVAVA
jgi:Fibronectin type III domain